jgi:hypothetical protein
VTTFQPPSIDQRVTATLREDSRRIPVLVGLCGAGRTSLLHRLAEAFGPHEAQYVNVERTATTPERFLAALTASSPFVDARQAPRVVSPRQAFDAVLAYFTGTHRADEGPVTYLLDEVLEFRTFESFPGLRRALPELLAVLAASPNRFVLTSRYPTRTERALAGASPQYSLVPMPALPPAELSNMLAKAVGTSAPGAAEDAGSGIDGLARLVAAVCGGRPSYAEAIAGALEAHPSGAAARDPMATLVSALGPGASLWSLCAFDYEMRLHRARGYGALKAILEILAEQEPLTLTDVSQRMGRTPGSTKDYLSWLEDVDLVAAHRKRYRFRDPLLRLWVRLYCHSAPPTGELIDREVREFVERCLG